MEENKVKKELREKSKILEDKLKELKMKEMQYTTTVAQKEKAMKEVDMLRKVKIVYLSIIVYILNLIS